jgi:predicted O-methyltransferase YrrM
MRSRGDYDAAFARECGHTYPAIDAFEARAGFAVPRSRLEAAARVLACPLKKSPPNWQHGRVVYAAARQSLAGRPASVLLLDIGTAKGFSALLMAWAVSDAGRADRIVSVDVLDPAARVARNSVAELEGLKTVHEFVAPWLPSGPLVEFRGGGSEAWLSAAPPGAPIGFAFIDGRHDRAAVSAEAAAIAARQAPGDVIVFDDLQIPGIADAVSSLSGYDVEHLEARAARRYAIARRR